MRCLGPASLASGPSFFGREFWQGLGLGRGLGAVFSCGVVGSFVFQDGPVGSVWERKELGAWAACVSAGCCQRRHGPSNFSEPDAGDAEVNPET